MAVLIERIDLMVKLGEYFRSGNEDWQQATELAHRQNGWFTEDFTALAVNNIATAFLDREKLKAWIRAYPGIADTLTGKTVGIVMAGNIPLVGFHDFLCGYLSGHSLRIKLSSKDTVLWQHIFRLLSSWDGSFAGQVAEADMLKGCDAYIATGSNNSARYFEQYFAKYPHIIRKNRTSVAVLDGSETSEELQQLANDVCVYFGLGCRNVTKVFVPDNYNFETLLPAFNKYSHHADHNKYKNNYDYQLAIYLLNKVTYMSNGNLLLVVSESPYAPISVLHYGHYKDKDQLLRLLNEDDQVQCIEVKEPSTQIKKAVPIGASQQPSLDDYADGVDTMEFLSSL